MKRYALPATACLLILFGLAAVYGPSLIPTGQPARVYVVLESATLPQLPSETVLWLNSGILADDAMAAGVSLRRLDPDVIDRIGGGSPKELVAVLERAKKAGLPRVVTESKAGTLRDYPLPKTEAEARRIMGLSG